MVCAFTCVENRRFDSAGTRKLVSSFKHFHPDIDFFVFGDNITQKVFKEKNLCWYNAKPTFAKLLTDKYDLIIHFDADCFVCAPLTEFLAQDYEIGATLNHNWFQSAELLSITNKMYVGASTWCCRNHRFLDDYEFGNRYAMAADGRPETPWREQGVFNLLYHYTSYKKRHFGVHGEPDDNGKRGFYGSQTLPRWQDFIMSGSDIMLDGKKVITLHEGGGYGRSGQPDSPRLDFQAHCKKEVASHMASLCDYNFTVADNGKVGQC